MTPDEADKLIRDFFHWDMKALPNEKWRYDSYPRERNPYIGVIGLHDTKEPYRKDLMHVIIIPEKNLPGRLMDMVREGISEMRSNVNGQVDSQDAIQDPGG